MKKLSTSTNFKTNQNKEILKRKGDFEFVLKVWSNVFLQKDGPFRVWARKKNGSWSWNNKKKKGTSISVPLYDLIYAVTVELKPRYPQHHMFTKCKGSLVGAIKSVFENGELDVSGQVTMKKLVERKDLIKSKLSPILEEANRMNGPRAFKDLDGSLKEKPFRKQEGLCNYCNQSMDADRISDGKYAHIDHIKPYSKGGETCEENAALVHADCNMAKDAMLR